MKIPYAVVCLLNMYIPSIEGRSKIQKNKMIQWLLTPARIIFYNPQPPKYLKPNKTTQIVRTFAWERNFVSFFRTLLLSAT